METAESRAKALWYATDTLIAGRFTEDEIRIFGEVIARLADAIEVGARAQLAKRLAERPTRYNHRLSMQRRSLGPCDSPTVDRM